MYLTFDSCDLKTLWAMSKTCVKSPVLRLESEQVTEIPGKMDRLTEGLTDMVKPACHPSTV